MTQPTLVVLLDNVRSAYNVGSIFRTADAVGVESIICCGITPYPQIKNDPRPQFEIDRTTTLIAKTALAAESTVACQRFEDTIDAINHFRKSGYQITALEQSDDSINYLILNRTTHWF